MKRREFLAGTSGAMAAAAALAHPTSKVAARATADAGGSPAWHSVGVESRAFGERYDGEHLNQIAFPLGGMGAGMFCVEGTGALSNFSLKHRPDLASAHRIFAAVSIKGQPGQARVVEGPVPRWKLRPQFPGKDGNSFPNVSWGLPRYRKASFVARFPFCSIDLSDSKMPLDVTLTGWSPFEPGDPDNASLPVAAIEYRFTNRSPSPLDAVFSFHSENLVAGVEDPFDNSTAPLANRIESTRGGFVLFGAAPPDRPWEEARFGTWVDEPEARVNHAWFRGQGISSVLDAMQITWSDIASAACYECPPKDESAPGASLYVPFSLQPGASKLIAVKFAWYVPRSNVSAPNLQIKDGKITRIPPHGGENTYRPWYAGQFTSFEALRSYWTGKYDSLRAASSRFSDALYRTSFPPEVVEAVTANLSILKSPAILRQPDGRLWMWEGVGDVEGAGGWGSCTHVLNYAQALAHLMPSLERGLREVEFGPDEGTDGFQAHRASLPIHPIGNTEEGHILPAATDGQLGGLIKLYRDWRISGDTQWLRRLWPRARASLDDCIRTWDPRHRGRIEEPHLNTYDVEFWGPDPMADSLYVGALKAAVEMGHALKESVSAYSDLLNKAIHHMENTLWNGEYFEQEVMHEGLTAAFPGKDIFGQRSTPDQIALAGKEGPPYQVGTGCLSDGVLGVWLSEVCGLGVVLDPHKVQSHLIAVHRYNLLSDFREHANAIRPEYACGEEGGLLLCSWPRKGRQTLPFFYADEVWTGIEHQVAAHLIITGKVEEGLQIVRACRRRYDGRARNPFSEIEAGHWYTRALSSFSLLQAMSGARYDAVEKVLYLKPAITGDFSSFLSTATGYGVVGVRHGKPFIDVVSGSIPYERVEYSPG